MKKLVLVLVIAVIGLVVFFSYKYCYYSKIKYVAEHEIPDYSVSICMRMDSYFVNYFHYPTNVEDLYEFEIIKHLVPDIQRRMRVLYYDDKYLIYHGRKIKRKNAVVLEPNNRRERFDQHLEWSEGIRTSDKEWGEEMRDWFGDNYPFRLKNINFLNYLLHGRITVTTGGIKMKTPCEIYEWAGEMDVPLYDNYIRFYKNGKISYNDTLKQKIKNVLKDFIFEIVGTKPDYSFPPPPPSSDSEENKRVFAFIRKDTDNTYSLSFVFCGNFQSEEKVSLSLSRLKEKFYLFPQEYDSIIVPIRIQPEHWYY